MENARRKTEDGRQTAEGGERRTQSSECGIWNVESCWNPRAYAGRMVRAERLRAESREPRAEKSDKGVRRYESTS
jgi:hypothetical protein